MWPFTQLKAVLLPLAVTLLTCSRLVAKSMTSGSLAVVRSKEMRVAAVERRGCRLGGTVRREVVAKVADARGARLGELERNAGAGVGGLSDAKRLE